MKVNYQMDISFKNIYTNKALKKSLEFAADNGALFGAAATVGFSAVRPLVIMNTPKTEKENREIASAKSIASSIIGFILMFAISTPLAKSIEKIDKNPRKFLNSDTIKAFGLEYQSPEKSKEYTFATQLFKLGIGTVAAVPKAIMVASGMPYIMRLFEKDNSEKQGKNPVFRARPTEKIAEKIGKTISKKGFQNFIQKFKNTNFPMHITALTDIFATAVFINQTKHSEKIKEERKEPLIFNSAISTALSVAGGYGIDRILAKPTEKFIKKYRVANAGQKNLEKQIQGIRIAKPILILGTIYYIFIPLISTFLAEKAENIKGNKQLSSKSE